MTATLSRGTAITNGAHAPEPAGDSVQPPRRDTAEPERAIDVTLRAMLGLAAFSQRRVRKRCRSLFRLTSSSPIACSR